MSGGVALDRVHLYSRVCAEMLRNLFLCVPLLLLAHVAAAAPVPVPDVEDGICRSETFDDRKKKCSDIGFDPGTEKFGDCVMRLME